MTSFEIMPNDSRKSFYGKAVVFKATDGKLFLKSYNTIVASIDTDGNFSRHWGGYSATTMRHINAFVAYFGKDGGGKKWWCEQPVTPDKFFLSCFPI